MATTCKDPLSQPEDRNIRDAHLPLHKKLKPEAHGSQRSPDYTAMKAIFSQNTVNVACKKS